MGAGRAERPAVLRSLTLARRQRSTRPQTLILFITSRCNARCSFCLYKESVSDPVRKSEEMSVDEYGRLARAYGPLHYLALSGGEPFVRRDVDLICQQFIDECGAAVVDIPSNFSYGDTMVATVERLAAANPGVVVDLQMSIDHLGEAHDRSREVTGLYERAIASFDRLEELRRALPNVRLKVNVVWLPENRDELEAIHGELRARLAYDRISVTYPHRRLPASGDPSIAGDFAAFSEASRAWSGDRGRGGGGLHDLGMRAAKRTHTGVLADAVSGRVSMGERCEAGRHILVVDEKAEVFPCEVLWEPIGNLRTTGFDLDAILDGDLYASFRERRLGPGRCSCTWSCAALTAVSVTPRLLGRLAVDGARTSGSDLRRVAERRWR